MNEDQLVAAVSGMCDVQRDDRPNPLPRMPAAFWRGRQWVREDLIRRELATRLASDDTITEIRRHQEAIAELEKFARMAERSDGVYRHGGK